MQVNITDNSRRY